MSALLEIQKEIGIANQRVAALERALADSPGLPSVAANLSSAVRIQKKLQLQFMEAAARVGVEVCRYRAFDENESVNAGPALGAIADFQKLFSVVFGSLKYGAKQRATVSTEVQAETAFQFGFAFSGSVGVVMTIRSDADLFDESFLDDTLGLISEMAKATTAKDVRKFSERTGPGAVNALYRWAGDSAHNGLGADIEWRRGEKVRGTLFVQRQELSKLRTAIEKTGTPHEDTITLAGTLVMADAHASRFKFKREGLPVIAGTVETGAIDKKHEATIPRRYKARILRTRRLRFARGTEEIKYHLLSLVPLNGAK